MPWCLLVLSLPTDNASARMRAWRSLKGSGAAVLRDGVYVLPDSAAHRTQLRAVADDVRSNDGMARVFDGVASDEPLDALFDRADEFTALLAETQAVSAALRRDMAGAEAPRSARRLRKSLEQLSAIDFFPGEAQRQAAQGVAELERQVARLAAPDEPRALPAGVPQVNAAAYRARTWVTRARPWVDRLACAWLIRRFIDPQARFLWLADPSTAPKRAVGFDFDGALFTHVGARVSFETLLAAFGLETPALERLGTLVHGLDAGGVMPPEAAGIERVLAGMRDAIGDDDALMLAAAGVFEGLYQSFEKEAAA